MSRLRSNTTVCRLLQCCYIIHTHLYKNAKVHNGHSYSHDQLEYFAHSCASLTGNSMDDDYALMVFLSYVRTVQILTDGKRNINDQNIVARRFDFKQMKLFTVLFIKYCLKSRWTSRRQVGNPDMGTQCNTTGPQNMEIMSASFLKVTVIECNNSYNLVMKFKRHEQEQDFQLPCSAPLILELACKKLCTDYHLISINHIDFCYHEPEAEVQDYMRRHFRYQVFRFQATLLDVSEKNAEVY